MKADRDRLPSPRAQPDKALLILPVLIALALTLWQARLEYGWLEMALGDQARLFRAAGLRRR